MVEKLKADGGIAITGSHNPVEWNALKFIRPDGLFLYPEQGEQLLELYRTKKKPRAKWNEIKKVQRETSAIENHLEKVLSLVHRGKIKSKKFKVVLDACNGAGALISPELIRRLGCEVVELNCKPNGIFPHPPEPIPPNLKELSEVVKAEGADVGFAHDADADRVALVSEKGEILPESYSLLLVSRFILTQKKGLVVTNLSTTQALDDVAKEYDCKVMRTRVGDVYVSRCMREERAVIGGEGNGGVIIPQIHYARDGIAAIALLLEYMAAFNRPLSELTDEIPRYYMIKGKIKFPKENLSFLKVNLRREFEEDKLNFLDGAKVYLNEGWIHIRASGTEPVVRIIVEAKTKKNAEALYNLGLEYLNSAKNGNSSATKSPRHKEVI
jgi:phosphomannomutase